ncbi:MAG TPA: hypothetical protein VHZ02_16385 [Acidimicrobiales bacterium]|jgi:hypothetical protein|nr:hypothetical protein [Acidimicrobiales bacterium]
MAVTQRWCRIRVIGPDGSVLVGGLLEGTGPPDLGAVDDVARLALLAGRLGGGITLADVSPLMRDLLELVGLGIEMDGQAEFREEPRRIQHGQEEVHPGDAPS